MMPVDPLCAEAFRHGRTQERLYRATKALLTIKRICADGRQPNRRRLLEIEAGAAEALRILSASTGGIIDDVEPV